MAAARRPLSGKRIAVVGSGVVGTATGSGFQSKGNRVVFCDVVPERLVLLRARGFHAVPAAELGPDHDAYFISVPSPTREGRVDLSCVEAAARTVGSAIADHRGRPLVVVRSTVPPGTTETLVREVVEEASRRAAGVGFSLCMNPEFLRELSAEEDFLNPRLIVIGSLDERSDRTIRRLYAPWSAVPTLSMSLRSAEMAKYVANLFNAAKISFFNEMEQVCAAIDAEPRQVFSAAARGAEGLWSPEYGTRGLFPFGGACLPKDCLGFLAFAGEQGLAESMLMLQATIETNERLAAKVEPDEVETWRRREQARAS